MKPQPTLTLEELRARLGARKDRREILSFSACAEGLPRGALVEITGRGRTETVARLLAEHRDLSAAWIEESLSLFPPALAQRNVALDSIFFIEGGTQTAWAAGAALRSQLFPVVIYDAPYGEERELRRFQLLAEKSHSTMLLLGEDPVPAWPISLALKVEAGRVRVERRR